MGKSAFGGVYYTRIDIDMVKERDEGEIFFFAEQLMVKEFSRFWGINLNCGQDFNFNISKSWLIINIDFQHSR